MAIVERFRASVEVAALAPSTAGAHLIGSRLAGAAADVLGSQGAGLSVSAGTNLRWPWGASGDHASAAERAQFTAGEGPCLTAYARQETVVADEAVIARVWPAFADQLMARTPFRSVVAVPFRYGVGAMDVYFVDPHGCDGLDVEDARAVAHEVLSALMDDEVVATLETDPSLPSPWAARSRVSVAIGILDVALGLDQADALTLMRSRAFGESRTVDDVAGDVVAGIVPPQRLL